ncbi:trigger factor [Tistlia consotensis]|uniref:Trigger factor n=1 Tax=Tistlia consotensis USBA 355 TaxID=560819 RepID=A0A1Y6BX38_9PROT|nr:trigger factor [Tistlia consotensis]SMF24479.1 trigger factor [Tistlia consotensis USBA 355]SNR60481.1 trigger factor [Tistlia consotensis]
MQVNETLNEGLKREFTVTLAAAEIEDKVQARLAEVAKTAQIPGFRPGKVPSSVLKQRYGDAVLGEVLQQAVNDASQQAINERGLTPAMQPQIEVTKFEKGEDLEYKLTVELMPEIAPMDFSTLELERVKVEVPAEEVDKALERLAENQRTTKPLESERPAESGDVLVIDFKGTVGGVAFPGMEGQDHHLQLGSNQFIAGFEDQLIGAGKGDERTVTVTFPEGYANDELSGKEAVFEVTVKDILATESTPIDDEMAKNYGAENLEDLRKKVAEQLGQEFEGIARSKVKRELLDKLAEGHDFPVPPGMVEQEFEAIWRQIEADREAGRSDPDDEGKDEETLKQEYRTIAERRVRLGLLLSDVGQKNGIEVTQDELNKALFQEAQRYPGREREVIEFFQKNPEAIGNLRGPVFEDKTIDFILALAKVAERKLTPDELQKELEAEAGDESASEGGEKAEGKAKKAPAKAKSKAKPKAAKAGDADESSEA